MYLTYINVNDVTQLRLLELRDASALFSLIEENRQGLRQWLPWLDANTKVEDSFDFIRGTQKQFAESTSLVMGLWHKETLVGVVGHNSINWSSRIAYPGYWLGESAQGQGLMTASLKALIKHAFSDLKLNRIDIRCATGNVKSCALPKRLGFTHEGTLKQAEWLYNRFVDHEVFGLVASEWQA